MNISSRLRQLESSQTILSTESRARERLLAFLNAAYDRVQGESFTDEWVRRQSNMTALAVSLFGTLPLSTALQDLLKFISASASPVSKLAGEILEVAT